MRTGKPKLKTPIDRSKAGEHVFSEMKNIISDSVEVRRIYDEEANTLLYVSYNNSLLTSAEDENASTKTNRYKTSISCIPLYGFKLTDSDKKKIGK